MAGRVIQIVGTGFNAGELPDIPGAERWGSNNPKVYKIRCPQIRSTWSHWFNMHSHRHMMTKYPSGYKWYQDQDGTRPIYLRDGADPTIKGSRPFPGKTLMEYFGEDEDMFGPKQPEDYFTFSASWFLAFAIHEHLEAAPIGRIELWGIMMQRESQYAFERECMHYWIGRARQTGIRVLIPPGVDLCKTPKLYGYQTTEPVAIPQA